MSRLPTRGLFIGAATLLALAVLFAWAIPSHDYLYLPNAAEPLAGRVEVAGTRNSHPGGGIYALDVSIRKASWLERVLPLTRPSGATLVPASAVVPRGGTFDDELAQGRSQMTRSQQIAAAVALRADGYSVKTTPRGVIVEAVAQDVPAVRVLKGGDVIVALNGNAVRTTHDLRSRLSTISPGTTVQVTVRRQGALRDLATRTVASPDAPAQALLGISVAQDVAIALPVKVNIDLGSVIGPSAGLPFALEVLDRLGHDVDRGQRIAATGELEVDGSIEPIGAVKQKTIGARRSGVDVMLVPAGDNADEARRYAGNMRVIPVISFQQALRILSTLPAK